MTYKQCPNTVPTLECTFDGEFRYKGKPKPVTYARKVNGDKMTAQICLHLNGVHHYWQAAKLVARTWKVGYKEGDYLTYKDGDCHHISCDNLEIADHDEYWLYMRRNSGYKADSVEERKRKLRNVIKEASLTLEYFETADMDGINKHVTDYLYTCLVSYCVNTLHIGLQRSKDIVADCIARMYECVMNGMCLYNYERYCKKLLHNYKTKGSFGLTGKVPKPILIHVEQLNLDCLCERYNVIHKKV